jgi:cell division septation protein DedD
MKITKIIIWIISFAMYVLLFSTNLVLAEPSYAVDAYVTDWTDTNYLIKNVRSDFQPNDPLSFYAYYGASTITIPFSNIKKIIVSDRVFLSHSEDFSEPKYYCSGKIILKSDEFLQCSWISNGWRGYNNYDGLISIGENSWKEVEFGRSFNHPIKKGKLSSQSAYPYTIHVSSYRDKHVANRVAIKLRNKGFPAFVCPAKIPARGLYHRIFIGFYRTFKETRKAALKLKGTKDLYPLEAKMPYAIQVGTANSDHELNELEADLQSKTYLTYAVPDSVANHKAKVLFGAFRTAKESAIFIKQLKNEGLEAKVIRR